MRRLDKGDEEERENGGKGLLAHTPNPDSLACFPYFLSSILLSSLYSFIKP
jgi:hypothetical protein